MTSRTNEPTRSLARLLRGCEDFSKHVRAAADAKRVIDESLAELPLAAGHVNAMTRDLVGVIATAGLEDLLYEAHAQAEHRPVSGVGATAGFGYVHDLRSSWAHRLSRAGSL